MPTLPAWFWPHYEDRVAAESKLFNQPSGSFLVRCKKSKPRGYCLSVVVLGLDGQAVAHARNAHMAHCEIEIRTDTRLALKNLIADGSPANTFGSITELVEYYRVEPLVLFGILLTNPIEREDAAAGGGYTKDGHFVRQTSTRTTSSGPNRTHPPLPIQADSVVYAVIDPHKTESSQLGSVDTASPSTSDSVEYAVLQLPSASK